jgi:hypothetical protein
MMKKKKSNRKSMNKVCCYRKEFLGEGFPVDHLIIAVVVPPPTLPPIPTIATGSTSAQDPWEGEFFSSGALEGGDRNTTSTTTPTTMRTRTPPTAMGLSDHPLPSPILRDLHSWMGVGEGESGPTVSGGANRSHAHPITTTNNSNLNTSIIVNPTIINTSNVAGTSNNSASTAARASSPSTSTTSTSTVRPSSVAGGFAGFAGFGGPASEVPAPSQSTYQRSSMFGAGNSGRSEAEDLRLTDPRLTGEIGHGGDGLPTFGGFLLFLLCGVLYSLYLLFFFSMLYSRPTTRAIPSMGI